jgi:hypothetical protein
MRSVVMEREGGGGGRRGRAITDSFTSIPIPFHHQIRVVDNTLITSPNKRLNLKCCEDNFTNAMIPTITNSCVLLRPYQTHSQQQERKQREEREEEGRRGSS